MMMAAVPHTSTHICLDKVGCNKSTCRHLGGGGAKGQ